ncbi:MAG: NADH-quinone oxidoreductase subunit NuoE [Dehalococcoidales bacterium]|nr:NADH-quinone oxidoreductase subunit NuoE [Dehalococcoidales bacterium]
MIEIEMQKRLNPIFSRFKGTKDEIIPVMEAVQDEFGYLPAEAMTAISRFLKVPESNIYGVATFYALFRLTPRGKIMVRVCRGTACHVRGGAKLLTEVEKELGIKAGETTPDMEYSLETISCFGSCALSPVVVVDKTVYGRVTPDKIKQILGKTGKKN